MIDRRLKRLVLRTSIMTDSSMYLAATRGMRRRCGSGIKCALCYRVRNPHYHEDFADLPLDVNGDGNVDIVTCAYFSGRVGWVEHPGDPTKPWIEHVD